MLADTADEDGALLGVVAQLLEAELRLQRLAGLAGLVGEGELLAPPADAAAPVPGVGLDGAAGQQILDRLDDLLDDLLGVADDRDPGVETVGP